MRAASQSLRLHPLIIQARRQSAPAVKRVDQALRVVTPNKYETFLNSTSLEYLENSELDASVGEVVKAASEEHDLDVPILTYKVHRPVKESARSASPVEIANAIKVAQLIRAYSVRGHLMCDLDPLGLLKNGVDRTGDIPAELDPEYFGFSDEDMDKTFRVRMHEGIGGYFSQSDTMSLRMLLQKLKEIYCGRIGWEFMHIADNLITRWLRQKIECDLQGHTFSKERKIRILEDLAQAELFEKFLHTKYATHKRFGLDGGDALIPGMMAIVDKGAEMGVTDIVIGMPHRGRLNVLATVCGKPLKQILHEFEGVLPDNEFGSGDVKYHLGTSQYRDTRVGKKMHISMVANPSHLEAVNPVVVGKTRAKQRYMNDLNGDQVVPILLHGDAAFSGQGICYETMGLANLYRYTVGGTIHIVVNNQIGFTTNPQDNRSSPYCTDIGKQGHPVFHVNGDDPESVVRACELAIEFRQKWKTDVIIDLICYRRHGHNETDEPMFTQPIMYKTIRKHPSVLSMYKQQLVNEGVVTQDTTKAIEKGIQEKFKEEYQKAKSYKPQAKDWLESRWEHYKTRSQLASLKCTGVDAGTLREIGKALFSKLPEEFTPHNTLKGILKKRAQAVESGEGIDWGTAEALAFATLLLEGNHVRLSGQDSERGTFSHRHAVLHDVNTDARYCPLGNLHKSQAHFEVCNSSLSEYGVLGFEVGYSMENPASLTLWEAQFGDFANGAQVIFDQFLSSGEAKWLRQCGLVVLLPHGYDGMGPEHSSARLERFLMMCDEDESGPSDATYLNSFAELGGLGDEITRNVELESERNILKCNWQVAYPSTPAQYFHILRRQIHREFRKPLIICFSKAFLRAPNVSNIDDFTAQSGFKLVIKDDHPKLLSPPILVKRVAFCTGQIYFHAANAREKADRWDVALVRVEQLAPFPFQQVKKILERYNQAEIVWLQEEPRNMGGWGHVRPRIRNLMKKVGMKKTDLRYIGRKASASPATGHKRKHDAEHEALMNQLFDF